MIFYSLPKKESLANGPQEPRSYPQALDIGKLQNVVISAGLDELTCSQWSFLKTGPKWLFH